MPRHVRVGAYYEFNRPVSQFEVGREISERIAQMDVRFGKDVYTVLRSDAKNLAKNVTPIHPVWHPAHNTNYFPHYYAGGDAKYGHVFYGRRGENFER